MKRAWIIAGACLVAGVYALHAQVVLPPVDTVSMACAYNTTPPTLTNGQIGRVQCDNTGTLLGGGGGGGGSVTQGTSPWIVQGQPNVTPTNCSGTITAGGTAQNAFTAGATKHGFTMMNLSTEDMWISFTTTAAPSTVASYLLNASATGAAGGSYSTPFGFGLNTALSVIGATTGNKFSCTFW